LRWLSRYRESVGVIGAALCLSIDRRVIASAERDNRNASSTEAWGRRAARALFDLLRQRNGLGTALDRGLHHWIVSIGT